MKLVDIFKRKLVRFAWASDFSLVFGCAEFTFCIMEDLGLYNIIFWRIKIMGIISRIRDIVYSLRFGIRLGYAFYVKRDVTKSLDLLMEYKRYSINKYGIWTIKDVNSMFEMIDILGRMEIYRFEADLLRQVYDLEEAKDLKERFGLLIATHFRFSSRGKHVLLWQGS